MTDKGKIRRSVRTNPTAGTVTITEHYGTVTEGNVEVIHEETFGIENFNDVVLAEVLVHGLKQKLIDCTASQSSDKGFTTAQRFETITDLFTQMDGETGTFNKAPKSGKSAANKADLAMAATMRARYQHSETPENERMLLAGLLNIEYKAL